MIGLGIKSFNLQSYNFAVFFSKTCKELDIEIIDMAINPDHVHLFIQFPPKYSVSFIAKKIKGRSSRILRKEFP
ncbi:MAG: IS200/IS605 family transposase [Methanosarcinales archaeon]|nr:IS200/IS605 family transposase [Methanosarcinales archaeon]